MYTICKNCYNTLRKFKAATFLNIIGLSVAFAVFIVIFTQLRFEFTYDSSYKNAENIYRMEIYDTLTQNYGINCCIPIYDVIGGSVPGIEKYAAYWLGGKEVFTRIDGQGVKRTYTEGMGSITLDFLDIFSVEIVAGNARAALENPNQLLLPQSVAQRIFGKEEAVGKVLSVSGSKQELVVGAVYKDFPKNSSLTNAIYNRLNSNVWSEWSFCGFFKLYPGTDVADLNQKINSGDAASLGVTDATGVEMFNHKGRYKFNLTPIKDSYFSQTVSYGYGEGKVGNKTMSYILMLIGLLIILIAYVNFTNFSTALAPVRVKNINTQRVMGASQSVLRSSIMTESALISLVSFGLSILWVWTFTQSALSQSFFDNPAPANNVDILVFTGVLSLLLGVLAGAYPALYMTSFQPALVLKGSFALTPRGIRLRNSLITVQFVTAMILIIGTLFIKLQHNYLRNQPIGLDRENVVVVDIRNDKQIKEQITAVGNEMLQNPHVYDYTTSAFTPGQVGMGWGRSFDGKQIQVAAWPVAHNFLRFFKIKIAEGSDFFEHNEKGANKYIFNQETLKKFDLKDVIGKEMSSFSNEGTVVGVAEDIHFASLHSEVSPMIFICGDDQRTSFLFLKIDSGNTPATIAHIKNVYSKFSENEIDLRFLDEEMDKLYKKEANLANMISLFSLIAIIIALMGIYGLILFNAKFKVREIGIRKVNGASEAEIIFLLNKGFLVLMILSFVIAAPIAYYLVFQWFTRFPYHVAMHWWVFAVAGVLTLLITLLTISYQSWKAAMKNPVTAIRANE